MLSEKYENYFEINKKILKWSGLWVPLNLNNTKSRLRLIFNTIVIFYAMIFFTVAELMSLKETANNMDDLIKNLNMSLSFILTITKICVWFANRKTILNIMDVLIKTTDKFKKCGNFNPDFILKNEMVLSYKLTMLFFVLACTVPSSACLGSFYTTLFDCNDNYKTVIVDSMSNNTRQIYEQRLPYYSWIPFDHTKSRFTYGIAVFYQCLALLLCGIMTVGFDMLYTAIVNLVSAHLKLLQGSFKTIRDRSLSKLELNKHETDDVLKDSKELLNNIHMEIGFCINHLQNILKICEKLESIFAYLILQQVLISLVVFCTCLYLVSSISFGIKFVFEITYLLAIETQLAMYCYVGNKVTTRAAQIPTAIYEGNWLSSDTSFKRSMLITMIRLQKPVYLTIGKFSPLTLTTFVTIGRSSYSLLAVLKSQQ